MHKIHAVGLIGPIGAILAFACSSAAVEHSPAAASAVQFSSENSVHTAEQLITYFSDICVSTNADPVAASKRAATIGLRPGEEREVNGVSIKEWTSKSALKAESPSETEMDLEIAILLRTKSARISEGLATECTVETGGLSTNPVQARPEIETFLEVLRRKFIVGAIVETKRSPTLPGVRVLGFDAKGPEIIIYSTKLELESNRAFALGYMWGLGRHGLHAAINPGKLPPHNQ